MTEQPGAWQETDWHVTSTDDTITELDSHAESGLSSEEAARRLEQYGLNELRKGEKAPAWKMFLAQFNDFMIWVLMVA
ncbi:MAG: cation-transporting P-type ATPase, partial [Coriobacteriia bacterium]